MDKCPGCGARVFAGEAFCVECGASLSGFATSGFVPARPVCRCDSINFSADGFCERCGTRGHRDHFELTVPGAAGVSDRGVRHERNEDAMALATVGGGIAAIVCDGVSSSPRPQEASLAGAETGLTAIAERLTAGEDAEAACLDGLRRAAEAVAALAESGDVPASTYVSAYVQGVKGAVTVAWVGDSRVYWLAPGGGSRRLTEDDSWAAHMVAQGALSEEEAMAHPHAHALLAWLGSDAEHFSPHVSTFTPDGPGTLIVCSDGLWNYFPDADTLAVQLGAQPPGADPLAAARHLTRLAVDSGGADNITVIVIPLEYAS